MWEHEPWVPTRKCIMHIHDVDPAGREPRLGAAAQGLSLCMLRKGQHSKSTAGGRGYLNTKEKEQDRDTIKMLSKDL